MAKSRRRRSSQLGLSAEDVETLWIPIGRGPGGGSRFLSKSGWKGIKVHDNVIDLKGFNKVSRLVIRNIYIHTIGTTLFIEGRAQA